MLFVTAGALPVHKLVATRRRKKADESRYFRCYYALRDYPGLLLVTQGPDFAGAELSYLAALDRPLLVSYEGPAGNSPDYWRAQFPELRDLPDIHQKVTLRLPREERVPETQELAAYLKDIWQAEHPAFDPALAERHWQRITGGE